MPRMHRSCETIRGKIEEHARMGKPLLDGWAMGPDGSTVSETVV
jgi:LDH2 family malate/lactate/ureidoglycolate dehydrogenase